MIVLIHSAGANHTGWRYQARWLAHHGHQVLAPDLPGHGASHEDPLASVEEIASWVREQMDEPAVVAGHSLGGLVALELARSQSELVRGLVTFGTAASMPVNADLLAAADAGDPAAVAMIIGWSYDAGGRLGGHPDPGIAASNLNARLIESELHSLGRDLRASNDYQRGAEAAASLGCPALVVGGGRDRMVGADKVRALGDMITDCEVEILEHAGHMMLTDSPEATRKLLANFLLLGLQTA